MRWQRPVLTKEVIREFDKLVSVAELAIKEKDIDSNERITAMQMAQKEADEETPTPLDDLGLRLLLSGLISPTSKKKRKSRREPDGSIVTELVD